MVNKRSVENLLQTLKGLICSEDFKRRHSLCKTNFWGSRWFCVKTKLSTVFFA